MGTPHIGVAALVTTLLAACTASDLETDVCVKTRLVKEPDFSAARLPELRPLRARLETMDGKPVPHVLVTFGLAFEPGTFARGFPGRTTDDNGEAVVDVAAEAALFRQVRGAALAAKAVVSVHRSLDLDDRPPIGPCSVKVIVPFAVQGT